MPKETIVHGLVLDGDLAYDAHRCFVADVTGVGVNHLGVMHLLLDGRVKVHLGDKPFVDLMPGDHVEGIYVGGRAVSFTHIERQVTKTQVVFSTRDV